MQSWASDACLGSVAGRNRDQLRNLRIIGGPDAVDNIVESQSHAGRQQALECTHPVPTIKMSWEFQHL